MIDEITQKRLEKKLKKAKAQLILDYPFIGNIAFTLETVWDTSIPTACTDGEMIKFNPQFVDDMSDDEFKFLLAHECMHPMLEHCFRRGNKDPYKWNQAGDYVINQILIDDSVGKMPSCGGLYDRRLHAEGGGTTEGIYNLLPETPEDEQGMGGEGKPLDNCMDSSGTESDRNRQQAKWKVRVAQSAQSAKMMGKMSAGLERLVDDMLKPRVDWRDVLHRFVVKARTDDRTFSRANRRFLPQGLYLPSVSGEAMGELVFAVDCSGSISQDEINQFASEITTVWQDQCPTSIHVIYFDSEVCHYDKFERGNDEPVIKPHGGGGTAFSPVFNFMSKNGIEPVACIFLTDLYCDDFGTEPQCPVLWVSTERNNMSVPFGEVVKMHDEK